MSNIFKPKINHSLNNNKRVYYSYLEANNNIDTRTSNEKPIETLNRLMQNGSYIFNRKVLIETKNKVYETKIAGRIDKRVITIDGDDILLSDIIKITEK